MSQLRFNIGVPRGGSAARSAEDDAEPRTGSLRPQVGSAARVAEERNRMEGMPLQRSVTIGLRAQGGRTAGDAAVTASSAQASATVTRHTPGTASTLTSPTISGSPVPPAALLSADSTVKEPVSEQSPQTVVARIQSLARSLFSPGVLSSKPN